MQVVNGAESGFASLLVRDFGFSSLNSTLLQAPYGFVILFANVSAMYVQRWVPGQQRCLVACLYLLPALAGTVGIQTNPRNEKVMLLLCYYARRLFPFYPYIHTHYIRLTRPPPPRLASTYTASFVMVMSLVTANVAGSTNRTTVNALFVISYFEGNMISPFAFKATEAPVYTSGIDAMLVAYCVFAVALLASFGFYMAWKNKDKADALTRLRLEMGEGVEGDEAADREARAVAAFSYLTVVKNPCFRHSYGGRTKSLRCTPT